MENLNLCMPTGDSIEMEGMLGYGLCGQSQPQYFIHTDYTDITALSSTELSRNPGHQTLGSIIRVIGIPSYNETIEYPAFLFVEQFDILLTPFLCKINDYEEYKKGTHWQYCKHQWKYNKKKKKAKN